MLGNIKTSVMEMVGFSEEDLLCFLSLLTYKKLKKYQFLLREGETSNHYQPRLNRLEAPAGTLNIPKQFNSIIDMDMYLFGLIYVILFEDKDVDVARRTELFAELQQAATSFKGDDSHKRAPGALNT